MTAHADEEVMLTLWLNGLSSSKWTRDVDTYKDVSENTLMEVVRVLGEDEADENNENQFSLATALNRLERKIDSRLPKLVKNAKGEIAAESKLALLRSLQAIYLAGINEEIAPPRQNQQRPANIVNLKERPSADNVSKQISTLGKPVLTSARRNPPPPISIKPTITAVDDFGHQQPDSPRLLQHLADRVGRLFPSSSSNFPTSYLRSFSRFAIADGIFLCRLVITSEQQMGFPSRREAVVRKVGDESCLFFAGVDVLPRTRAAKLKNVDAALNALRSWKRLSPKYLWSGSNIVDSITNDGLKLVEDIVSYVEKQVVMLRPMHGGGGGSRRASVSSSRRGSNASIGYAATIFQAALKFDENDFDVAEDEFPANAPIAAPAPDEKFISFESYLDEWDVEEDYDVPPPPPASPPTAAMSRYAATTLTMLPTPQRNVLAQRRPLIRIENNLLSPPPPPPSQPAPPSEDEYFAQSDLNVSQLSFTRHAAPENDAFPHPHRATKSTTTCSPMNPSVVPPLLGGKLPYMALNTRNQTALLEFLSRRPLMLTSREKHATRVWLFRMGFNIMQTSIHVLRTVPANVACTKEFFGYEGGDFLGDPIRNGRVLYEIARILNTSFAGRLSSVARVMADDSSFPNAKHRVEYALRELEILANAHGLKGCTGNLFGETAQVHVLSGGPEVWGILYALSLAFTVSPDGMEATNWEKLRRAGLVQPDSMNELDSGRIPTGEILRDWVTARSKAKNRLMASRLLSSRIGIPKTRKTAISSMEKSLEDLGVVVDGFAANGVMDKAVIARRIHDGDYRLFFAIVESVGDESDSSSPRAFAQSFVSSLSSNSVSFTLEQVDDEEEVGDEVLFHAKPAAAAMVRRKLMLVDDQVVGTTKFVQMVTEEEFDGYDADEATTAPPPPPPAETRLRRALLLTTDKSATGAQPLSMSGIF